MAMSGVSDIWRWSDWVERSIFIGLALMLGYTAFVVVRFSRRYNLVRRESCALSPDSILASQPGHKRLVAELGRGVGALKAIAWAAPFLGLAGTCYGILAVNYGVGNRKNDGIGSILANTAGALVPTVAGVIAAIPAAVFYNVLRTLIENFESNHSSVLLDSASRSYGFAQTLPLQRRFSRLPAFALIGAPVLGLLVPMSALMLRSTLSASEGLPVHLLRIDAFDHDLPPIVVSVKSANGSSRPVLYVNSKETSWDELGNTLRSQLEVRPRWIVYVEGGDDVDWAYVADVIDVARGLHAEVVLLTTTPNIESGRAPGAKMKRAKVQ